MNRLLNLTKSLGRGIRSLSPTCHEAARLQSEKLDRKLPWLRRIGLRLHLVLCKWCRRYGRQLRIVRSAARRCDEERATSPQEQLSARARERISKSLRAEKK